jgi:hypothetical protein
MIDKRVERQAESIAKLSDLWVKWNIKEITGDEFATAFRKEFPSDTRTAWDNRQKIKKTN